MKRYRTIVVDPPWHYERFAGSVGYGGKFAGRDELAAVQIKALPYASMTLDEIAALPIVDLADRDCWLFLWTTNRYLFDAKRIAIGWEFRYAQTIVWRKTSNVPPFGGTFGPNHAEFLLACRRGAPKVRARWPASVVEAPKPNGEHSRKPEVFLDLIEQSTDEPRVELFARRARFGWDYWGDESLGTARMDIA